MLLLFKVKVHAFVAAGAMCMKLPHLAQQLCQTWSDARRAACDMWDA